MKIAIIGRTEILYETALMLRAAGHSIVFILTAKEAPEYTRKSDDYRSIAEKWEIPFRHGANITEFSDCLKDAQADIGVSVNYPGIIPLSVINIFPLGILNAHGGDLPLYRGNACQAWAILNGEERIGLCIHKMVPDELDSGDIISRDYLAINHNTKITYVWEWMVESIPKLFCRAIDQLKIDANYVLECQSKDPNDALRCYPRRPEDGRIDWNDSNINVLRLINASNNPYSGAFCYFENEKITIWDAELVEQKERFCATPGQVTAIGIGFIEVSCGEGKIRILRVDFGGEVKSPDLFIKSIRKRLS